MTKTSSTSNTAHSENTDDVKTTSTKPKRTRSTRSKTTGTKTTKTSTSKAVATRTPAIKSAKSTSTTKTRVSNTKDASTKTEKPKTTRRRKTTTSKAVLALGHDKKDDTKTSKSSSRAVATRKTPARKTTTSKTGGTKATTSKASKTTKTTRTTKAAPKTARTSRSKAAQEKKPESVLEDVKSVQETPVQERHQAEQPSFVEREEEVVLEKVNPDEYGNENSYEGEAYGDFEDTIKSEHVIYGHDDLQEILNKLDIVLIHNTSHIIEYREGRRLIVEDILGNRHKLTMVHSHTGPNVEISFMTRQAKGGIIVHETPLLLENESVGNNVLSYIAHKHDAPQAKEHLTPTEPKTSKASPLSSFKEKLSKIKFTKIHISKTHIGFGVLGALVLGMGLYIATHNNTPKNIITETKIPALTVKPAPKPVAPQQTQPVAQQQDYSGQQTITLSPNEQKIREYNMILAEIDRLINGQPPQGRIGVAIQSRNLSHELLLRLRDDIQKKANEIASLQNEMNGTMGNVIGGKQVPLKVQTDRYGISNTPPDESWASATGVKPSIPSGSAQGITSQKDLEEFGVKN